MLDFDKLARAVDQIALDAEGRITGAPEATKDFVEVMGQIFSGKEQPDDWQEAALSDVFVSRVSFLTYADAITTAPTERVWLPGSILTFFKNRYYQAAKPTIAVTQYKPSTFGDSIRLTALADVEESGILSGLKHYLYLNVDKVASEHAASLGFSNLFKKVLERESPDGLTVHPDLADAWRVTHEELAKLRSETLDLSKTSARDQKNRTYLPTYQHELMRRHELNVNPMLARATALRQARLTALVRG